MDTLMEQHDLQVLLFVNYYNMRFNINGNNSRRED